MSSYYLKVEETFGCILPELFQTVRFSNISNYLIIIVLGALVTCGLKFLWDRRNLYLYARNVPGPFAFPFIGCGYLFLRDSSNTLDVVLKIQKKWPRLAKLWLGQDLVYLVGAPEHIEKILTNSKALNRSHLYKFLTYIIGTGLLTAPVQKWKKHRKVIIPTFKQNVLNSFVETFTEQSIVLTQQLQKYIGQKNIDIFHSLSRCTLDIMCETAMGVKMNMQSSNNVFADNFNRLLELISCRMTRVWYHLDFVWKLLPIGRENEKCVKVCHDVVGSVIQKKIHERDREAKFSYNKIEDEPLKKKIAFLDLILENSNFTEEEFKEEVIIFIVAGADTTASTLSFILIMLGLFPTIQKNVYEEIVSIMGTDRKVLPADLPEMKYTERVIKETLRLFPTAPLFARNIERNIDLGDTILPKQSMAGFCPVHIHRNPEYWPNPLTFDPDRFLPEETAKRHPCAYIPFSFGPRNCIGRRYAMMTMKTVLVYVLRKYIFFTEYKSIEEIKMKWNIVLRLEEGSKISIVAR